MLYVYSLQQARLTPRDSVTRDIEQGVDAMMIMRRRTLRSFLTAIFALTILPLLSGAASALDNGQCFDCHGDRGILGWSPEEKASNVTPGGPKVVPHVGGNFPGMSLHIDSGLYKQSVHADVSCTDCHSDVKAVPHAARLKRADCSSCHSEVAATYAKSRHVLTFGKSPIGNAPVCVDCHGAHAIQKVSSLAYKQTIPNVCGKCHGGRESTYLDTYHGKAITLGRAATATCVDCHGDHSILPVSDPQSTLSSVNVLGTCRKCHPQASKGFSTFLVHIKPTSTKAPPIVFAVAMFYLVMIVVVFAFGGIHTLLYVYRGLKDGLYFGKGGGKQ